MSGVPWTNSTPASKNRKNKTSVISDTGDNLALLNKSQFAIVVCTQDGDIFVKDHAYLFGIDTEVIDISDIANHTHSGGVSGGGDLIYIYQNNPETNTLYLSRPTDLIKANWNQTVTGTGSIEDGGGGANDPYIRLRPNGTSGSGSTISYTNGRPDIRFSEQLIFVSVGNFETATSLAFHAGVNADDVTAADSNTVKVQAEVCTATNNNWWLRTATGSANSASDIGVAIDTNNHGIKIVHEPTGTPHTIMSVTSGGEFTKTTNIPTASTSVTQGNNLKFSIKNSTAADRPYRFKGCRIDWTTGGTWGYGGL